jgi:hypothetical protein
MMVDACGPGLDRVRAKGPRIPRQRRGQTNYRSGAAAEGQVERAYLRTGHRLRNRRWRGGVG